MNLAIAFFGLPRAANICFPKIMENIVEPAALHASQVNIFYHFYRQDMVINPRSGELGSVRSSDYDLFANWVGELEDPGVCLERWQFDHLKACGDIFGDGFKSLRNLVHQLNSLHRVTQLVATSKPDAVLFVRPDLLYHDRFRARHFALAESRPDVVMLPDWQWWGGYNDRFALCGRDVYRKYGERIVEACRYCTETSRPLNGEHFLRFALDRTGVDLVPLRIRASRVRVGGVVKKESFSRFLGMGGRQHVARQLLLGLRSLVR